MTCELGVETGVSACRTEALVQRIMQLLAASSHSGLAQLRQPLLRPLLTGVLQGSARLRASMQAAGGPAVEEGEVLRADQAARGVAWAYLGALRLHLVLPPPGADPAAKHAHKRGHLLRLLAEEIAPELEVLLSRTSE